MNIVKEDNKFVIISINNKELTIPSWFYLKKKHLILQTKEYNELKQYLDRELLSEGKSYSLFLLSRKGYFQHQLAQKLKQRGFPAHIMDEICQFLHRCEYLSDHMQLENFIRSSKQKGYGPLLIIAKLIPLIGQNLSTYDIEQFYSYEEQVAVIVKLIQAKIKGYKQDRPKMIRYLFQKGFSQEVIYAAWDQYMQS